MENQEKVIYCGWLGPVWQKGLVTKKEAFVKVRMIEGTNMYRLFDHVTVGIQLKGGESHVHSLSLSLLDKAPWRPRAEGEAGQAARREQEKVEAEEDDD